MPNFVKHETYCITKQEYFAIRTSHEMGKFFYRVKYFNCPSCLGLFSSVQGRLGKSIKGNNFEVLLLQGNAILFSCAEHFKCFLQPFSLQVTVVVKINQMALTMMISSALTFYTLKILKIRSRLLLYLILQIFHELRMQPQDS